MNIAAAGGLGESPFDPQCVPACTSEPGGDLCVGPGGAALGATLAVLTFFAVLPQIHKIWKLRSSEGFSLASLLLVVSFGACNFAGTIVIKWRVIAACFGPPPGANVTRLDAYDCFTELLDAQQQVASLCASMMLVGLMMHLPPHRSSRKRRLVTVGVMLLQLGYIIACAVASVVAPCSAGARGMAQLAAIGATGFVLTAQLPQVAETYRTRGRGSLSYL